MASRGRPGEAFGACAAAPRRVQVDIFSTDFFCTSRSVSSRRRSAMKLTARRLVLGKQATCWNVSEGHREGSRCRRSKPVLGGHQALELARAQNRSSHEASTSPAVLCERARRPNRLAEDGSLH